MRLELLSMFVLGALIQPTGRLMSADALQFRSAATRCSLLELYTSEGCNSCPPAEAWLSRLKESPGLWKDFVPVAFHVDYWDYLGWKDPFASKAHTQRQHDYAAFWRSRSVYTPGFVLDGKEWRDWLNHHELPRVSSQPVGALTARSEDTRQWTIRFQPTAESSSLSYDISAALLGFDLSSDVKAGENRGRKLQHDFVVLAMANATSSKKEDFQQGVVSLNPPSQISPKRLAVVVWVTLPKSMQPVQAVGGWLSATHRVP